MLELEPQPGTERLRSPSKGICSIKVCSEVPRFPARVRVRGVSSLQGSTEQIPAPNIIISSPTVAVLQPKLR